MPIDRLSKPPKIQAINSIALPEPVQHHLNNGAILYDLRLGSQAILKIEWIFDAGRWWEDKALVSRATVEMLKSGALQRNADELADFFDYYGAKLSITDDFDTVSLRLYCLTKHLDKLLPVMSELLLHPTFDADELLKFSSRNKQYLKLQLPKNDVMAYRVFTESLFGNDHPYGYNSTFEHYDALTTEDLRQFHQQCYHGSSCRMIVSGKTTDAIILQLVQHLEQLPSKVQHLAKLHVEPVSIPEKIHLPSNKTATQASIRIGSRLFTKKHPDYAGFYFLNTLLGGYFGARLMQNLREDKGYTYSVYSSMETMRHGGYFYIYTDVNTDVKEAALTEIYHELERLQTELVEKEELEMLRNYSLGTFLTAVDGVFNVSNIIKDLVHDNIDHSFYNQLIEVTNNITPEQIRDLARTYFNKENLCEVVVG